MSGMEESDDSDFGDIDFNIGDDLLKKAEDPDDFDYDEESEDISHSYDENYMKYDVKKLPGYLNIDFELHTVEQESNNVSSMIAVQKEFLEEYTKLLTDYYLRVEALTKQIRRDKEQMHREKQANKNRSQKDIHDMQDRLEIELKKVQRDREYDHERNNDRLKEVDNQIHHRNTTVKGITNLTDREVLFLKKDPHQPPKLSTKRPKFHEDFDPATQLSNEHNHYHYHTIKHVHRHFYHDEAPKNKEAAKNSHYVQNRVTTKCGHIGSWVPEITVDEEGNKIKEREPWKKYWMKMFNSERSSQRKENNTFDETAADYYFDVIENDI